MCVCIASSSETKSNVVVSLPLTDLDYIPVLFMSLLYGFYIIRSAKLSFIIMVKVLHLLHSRETMIKYEDFMGSPNQLFYFTNFGFISQLIVIHMKSHYS